MPYLRQRLLLFSTAFALLSACDSNGHTDSGPADAAQLSDATSDAMPSDAGQAEDAALDAGAFDAGAFDAGAFDAGTDADVADASIEDGGPTDAGTLDGGPDAASGFCPPMAPPAVGCIVRCEIPATEVGASPRTAALSPDGSRVAFSHESAPHYRVFDLTTGTGTSYDGPFRSDAELIWHPGRNSLIVGSDNQVNELPLSGDPVEVLLRRAGATIVPIAISPSGTTLYAGRWEYTLPAPSGGHDVLDGTTYTSLQVRGMALSPDGNRLAVMHSGPPLTAGVTVIDLLSGDETVVLPPEQAFQTPQVAWVDAHRLLIGREVPSVPPAPFEFAIELVDLRVEPALTRVTEVGERIRSLSVIGNQVLVNTLLASCAL